MSARADPRGLFDQQAPPCLGSQNHLSQGERGRGLGVGRCSRLALSKTTLDGCRRDRTLDVKPVDKRPEWILVWRALVRFGVKETDQLTSMDM